MLRLVRLAKLLKLMRMSRIIRTIRQPLQDLVDKFEIDLGYVDIMRYFAYFYTLVHWLSCINAALVREFSEVAGSDEYVMCKASPVVMLLTSDDDDDLASGGGRRRRLLRPLLRRRSLLDAADDLDASFFDDNLAASAATTVDPLAHSWWAAAELDSKSPKGQYEWALYKAISQILMIAFDETVLGLNSGDCVLDKGSFCAAEHWLNLAALFAGLMFQSLVISQISSILVEMSLLKQKYREEMRLVSTYMGRKKLPPEMRDRVFDFFDRAYKEDSGVDEGAILSRLLVTLRNEIMQYNAKELLSIVPLLRNTPREVFTAFAQDLHSETFQPNECVLNEGESPDVSSGVYFIRAGVAEVLAHLGGAKPTNDAPVIATIGDGCYFGEVAVTFDKKRGATVRAKTRLICYTLDEAAWNKTLDDFKFLKDYVELVARRREWRVAELSKVADAERSAMAAAAANAKARAKVGGDGDAGGAPAAADDNTASGSAANAAAGEEVPRLADERLRPGVLYQDEEDAQTQFYIDFHADDVVGERFEAELSAMRAAEASPSKPGAPGPGHHHHGHRASAKRSVMRPSTRVAPEEAPVLLRK